MRKENIQRSTQAVIAIVLVMALAGMVNWLGARHWKRADWTESQLYTLSEKSLNIIKSLEKDLRITVFMTPASSLYPQVRELLNRYDAASDKISVEFIDPDRAPLRTKELAEKFQISAADTVVFSSGERSKYVTAEQMAEVDYSGMQMGQAPSLKSFKGEGEFTAAILSLVAQKVPKIYLVKGHGEASLAVSKTNNQRSLSQLKIALERENMEVKDASLLGGHVPEDADVLIVAGPTRAFSPLEIKAIEGYLEKGGHLLLALDPLIESVGGIRPTGLESMLADWGVEVQDDLVIDPSRRIPGYDLSAVYLDSLGQHPITKGMDGLAALFLVARSINVAPDAASTVTPLVETTADGWGEKNLQALLKAEPVVKEDNDLPGPVAVAVAVESAGKTTNKPEEDSAENQAENPASRIVVFGDSDFLLDGQILIAGNQVLAVNAVKWLAAQDQSLGIPPKEITKNQLFLSSAQLNFVLLFVVILMPGTAILAGIFIWRRRKH